MKQIIIIFLHKICAKSNSYEWTLHVHHNQHSPASWQLLFPPFLLPTPLILSPLHKVLDIFTQSDGLYDSAYHCAHSRLDQLVEGGLRVPVAPSGRAVHLLKLLLTGVGPGEGWHLHVGWRQLLKLEDEEPRMKWEYLSAITWGAWVQG